MFCLCECLVPEETRRGHRSPGNGVTDVVSFYGSPITFLFVGWFSKAGFPSVDLAASNSQRAS